ncbi:alginate lyase family protein [Sphingomonas abietis]|uniref:Alginate lyase family protein n=1 Tax=Sphingomonas abietis TaxID=3012344 RepID=A0ABY7NJS2_9SPHN|nr:alginate lyase family protein [Sphingomonas abietis]WBO21776.1 alginate lyase family protein [Sphingomonas abietis]
MKEAAFRDGDAGTAYRGLLARADAALDRPPPSVVEKGSVPPSGDLHDYMSIAPYWWPNPAVPGGRPYVRKDGSVNPERATADYDLSSLSRMSADVETLALAYYFSEDSRYARHAASLLRTWFVDPETRMKPNVEFGQAVLGRANGRPEGIIETTRLMPVVEAIGLLGPSGEIDAGMQADLERWFGAYVDWLQTSPRGKREGAKDNNHALWYDAQVMQFALFARQPDRARRIAAAFPKRRMLAQFTRWGGLPKELSREQPFHYSIFALQAAYDVADLGRCVGVRLWNKRVDGRSLRRTTNFLIEAGRSQQPWPYNGTASRTDELEELSRRARDAWGSRYVASPEAELRYFLKARSSASG